MEIQTYQKIFSFKKDKIVIVNEIMDLFDKWLIEMGENAMTMDDKIEFVRSFPYHTVSPETFTINLEFEDKILEALIMTANS